MKKLGKTLIQVQYGASIVAALMLLVMIGYEVFARYVLKSSLMGIEELMLFPIIWLYMLGGANASYEKSHIECGIDRKSTRLNSSHVRTSRMPSSA